MSVAVRVENLGKRYQLGMTHAGSIRELVNRTVGRLLGRRHVPLPHEVPELVGERADVEPDGSFWALRDVSFEVKPGEAIGIIGQNGAGKSTLLKILSQITAPTHGRVELHGRVASLLEVGTGFHPELSGRENVFLNGAILGMTKAEIRRKFDEIVAFAEIEQFIDTPVKRYSSGMYVRLAFAVAAHLEPEILVVDEVLAVGDVAFQKKCLGKMGDVARHGRTVLFVSHNMQAVRTFCARAVWLNDGWVIADGPADRVVHDYLQQTTVDQTGEEEAVKVAGFPADPAFRMERVSVLQEGRQTTVVVNGKPVEIEVRYEVFQETPGLHVYFLLYDSEGTLLFDSLHNGDEEGVPTVHPGRYVSRAFIPADFLAPMTYRLHVTAGIANVRGCIPEPVRFTLDVRASGRVNRAYPGYVTPGRLAPWLLWQTTAL